jgi:murein DD-endopeptidase MepM/ murein hydrolase activator NlpD
MRPLAVVALSLGVAACAPTARVVAEPTSAPTPAVRISVPDRAAQGSLVVGTVPPGSRLRFDERDVRVAANGRFVIGIARERERPAELALTLPDGARRTLVVQVDDRAFPLERIDGVPEDTVNPPPAIAERIADEQAQVANARRRDDARTDFDTAFAWPVSGRISGVFGSQRIYNGTPKSPHSGLDVAAPQGTPVKAPAAGIVTFADPDLYLTGGTVLIDHGHGVSSSFLHLSRIDVKVGERVEQGQPFGLVGRTGRATGPHMHWGLNWFDTRVDPQLLVDPAANPQSQRAGDARR